MCRQQALTKDQEAFIRSNVGKIKQYKLAQLLNTSPATVNRVVNEKGVYGMAEQENFDITDFAKYYSY